MIRDHFAISNLTDSSSTLGSTTVHMLMVHFAVPACFFSPDSVGRQIPGQFITKPFKMYGVKSQKNELACYFRLSCDVSYQNGRVH